MTDLTFCYLHMTHNDLLLLDTIDSPEYIKGDLSDDELDIPPHLIPPNPDDSDILPSQVHPSYPYGNPTNIKHPAARPRPPYDPTSRALFEDMGYAGGGINGALRWRDLALDELLPVDEEKEEALRAAQARKMASGASGHNPHTQHQSQPQPELTIDEEDEEEADENDENDEADEEEEEEVDEDDLDVDDD
ncbi:hypothetical protein AGABI1DRAFT_110690 [Agaricus bisporus var. burnettii JB137-S8]|uniref:Uncharacterized protein n=2 Tax=Agaricus bisporus var. burnettii TaxID=192524 RepID=K5Y7B6_AGABU|nr:uncharacterized protein AGABI1DRAFT_110690 [Agaricus bisporus var. burnettii JB137-S8]EKM84105.1 hypothetical protein AGABI1DRAFT_110690 [Agaricus bisporus var. burnettii JB137-S8]KAF7784998.1 hypothetical protein Agabi119p4_1163 [Agaricus bisporus var. burnettii]